MSGAARLAVRQVRPLPALESRLPAPPAGRSPSPGSLPAVQDAGWWSELLPRVCRASKSEPVSNPRHSTGTVRLVRAVRRSVRRTAGLLVVRSPRRRSAGRADRDPQPRTATAQRRARRPCTLPGGRPVRAVRRRPRPRRSAVLPEVPAPPGGCHHAVPAPASSHRRRAGSAPSGRARAAGALPKRPGSAASAAEIATAPTGSCAPAAGAARRTSRGRTGAACNVQPLPARKPDVLRGKIART